MPERAAYDNLVVRGLDGTVLFSDDVSATPDPAFPQVPVVNGQLEPGDGVTLLSREASAPVLRHEFTLDKPVASARAYVYGLGFAELRLNGAKVGDRALTPTAGQYATRSFYNTYDVTEQLHAGANAVGLWLGTGYGEHYNQYAFRYLGRQEGDHAAAGHVRRRHAPGRHDHARRLEVVDRRDHRQRPLRRRDL